MKTGVFFSERNVTDGPAIRPGIRLKKLSFILQERKMLFG